MQTTHNYTHLNMHTHAPVRMHYIRKEKQLPFHRTRDTGTYTERYRYLGRLHTHTDIPTDKQQTQTQTP